MPRLDVRVGFSDRLSSAATFRSDPYSRLSGLIRFRSASIDRLARGRFAPKEQNDA